MKPGHIDYYFWLNPDWAYLGAARLEALARRQGAEDVAAGPLHKAILRAQ